jgi:alpha-1,6-mannosyltransferase
MIRGERAEQPRRRLVSAINNPRLMVAIMFVCMWVVAMLAVQRNHVLGVDAPSSRLLTLGGFLTGSARMLGISRLTSAGMSELYAVLIVVLFLCYIWALVLVARGKATMSRGFIIGASVALCLWVLFITPLYAKDLFNYASYGKMLSFHGVNPYLHGAADFPRDPVLPYISWKNAISVYGPLFTYLSALITLIARQGAIANIFAFKIVGFAFFLGSLFVVDSLARRMFPSRRAFILAAVAWNPLVIIHLVGGAHNDLVMLFFVLLAFLLYRQEKPVWALFSCMLAVLIKTTAVFVLVPMLVLFLKQNSRWTLRKYGQAAAVLVITPLAFYLPIWPGTAALRKIISVGTEFSAASVPRLFRDGLATVLRHLGMNTSSATSFAMTTSRAVFILGFLALLVFFCYRVRDIYSLLLSAAAIMFAFAICTTWLMPWYAGFVAAVMIVSGSYLMAAGGIGLTLVLSLYAPRVNGSPYKLYPAALVVLTLVLLVVAFRSRLAGKRLVAAEAGPGAASRISP